MPQSSDHPMKGEARTIAYVGCFTTPRRRGTGDGISLFEIGSDGAWTQAGKVSGLDNPSFLCFGPACRTLHAAHADLDYLSSYARDPQTGALRPLGRTAVGGANVVHAAILPSGRLLLTANYASGSVTLLRLDEEGRIETRLQVLPLPGEPGPNRADQRGSHPHQILLAPGGRFILVPDKGHDAVHVLELNETAEALSLVRSFATSPGAGPRHAAFHPTDPVCWIVNELDSSITTFRWSGLDSGLDQIQSVPLLPDDAAGVSAASAIVVSGCGRFVYASNRGHDSVVAFAVAADGRLDVIGWTPTFRKPRFMTRIADRLLVAAEWDGRVDIFPIGSDGMLGRRVQTIHTPSPASIAFAPDDQPYPSHSFERKTVQPSWGDPGKMSVHGGPEVLGLGGPDPALAFDGRGRLPRG